MRNRIIHPEFFESTQVSELSYEARILFIGLWCMADRDGRFKWNEKIIHGKIFPLDDEINVKTLLKELVNNNLVTCHYIVNTLFGQVTTFKKWQKIHPHEAKSRIPELNKENQCDNNVNTKSLQSNDNVTEMSRSSTSVSTSTSTSLESRKLDSTPTINNQELVYEIDSSHSGVSHKKINGRKPNKTWDMYAYFMSVFKKTTGSDYIQTSDKKDLTLIKILRTKMTDEKLKELINRFFAIADTDSFIKTTGKDIGVFKSQVNKLNSMKKGETCYTDLTQEQP